MKKIVIIFLLLRMVSAMSAQQEKKIVILHTNDLHSRLAGYAPESDYSPMTVNDDKTIGGFARIASIIKDERNKNRGITIIADAEIS